MTDSVATAPHAAGVGAGGSHSPGAWA
jgi:hypothetical protein